MTRLPRSGALAVAEKKELDRRRSPVIQRGWCFRNGIAGAATFVEILLVRTDVIELTVAAVGPRFDESTLLLAAALAHSTWNKITTACQPHCSAALRL